MSAGPAPADNDSEVETGAVLRAPRQITGDAKHDATAVVAAAAARRRSLLATMARDRHGIAGTRLPNRLCVLVCDSLFVKDGVCSEYNYGKGNRGPALKRPFQLFERFI